MKLAFTICSNNYLAQAKVLADSINLTNPDYKFYIFLVDDLSSEIDYSFFNAVVVPVKELSLEEYNIFIKYDIIELNTSIKPVCFEYLFKKYEEIDNIHYFDPDIQLFGSLNEIDKKFRNYSFLITPHILTPNNEFDKMPSENLFLMYGIYNLGYIGLKGNDESVISFLKWWKFRTLNYGFNKISEGFFVDQLWVNFLPIFYSSKVNILDSPGYNMAPWNLHERNLTIVNGKKVVNEKYELIFYHFSSYSFLEPNKIAKNNKYTFQGREYLEKLYEEYHELLILNKVSFFSGLECVYFKIDQEKLELKEFHIINASDQSIFYEGIKKIIKLIIPPILVYLLKNIRKAFSKENFRNLNL